MEKSTQVLSSVQKIGIVAAFVLAAFLAGRAYASTTASSRVPAVPSQAGPTSNPSTLGGGCCGSGARPSAGGSSKSGVATTQGDTQSISVDLSQGYYDPSTIRLRAGVPAEITFGQSSGCTGQVQSQELGFFEDLTSGPKTVKLPALSPGTYSFACGMGMVSSSIVVE